MNAFQRFEPERGVVCYRLEFESDVYVAVFHKAFGKGDLLYQRMQYRKHEEAEFSILDERTWSFAISQILRMIENLEALEVDPDGGIFSE